MIYDCFGSYNGDIILFGGINIMSPRIGRKHTQEELEKMREWHRIHPVSPELREKRRNTWLGRKHTEETKEKMRQSSHKADLVGKRFGRLVVVSLDRVSKQRQTVWLCKCDCGNEKVISIVQLRDGGVRSCGCLRHETSTETGKMRTIGFGKAAGNSVLYGYKKSARLRGLSWELSDDEFFELVTRNCHYCGDPPSLVSKRSATFNGSFIHNGIDRINNSLGYTKENCVPCCKNCNYAKRKLDYDEFLVLIRKIYETLNLRSMS